MDMQAMVDAMGSAMQETRKDYHLTLGKLVDALEDAQDQFVVVFDYNNQSPGEEMSYRGHYIDLALEPDNNDEPKMVDQLRHELRHAIGKTYDGYKGGDFTMTRDTPLWAATYGTTGRAIIDTVVDVGDGVMTLITKDVH